MFVGLYLKMRLPRVKSLMHQRKEGTTFPSLTHLVSAITAPRFMSSFSSMTEKLVILLVVDKNRRHQERNAQNHGVHLFISVFQLDLKSDSLFSCVFSIISKFGNQQQLALNKERCHQSVDLSYIKNTEVEMIYQHPFQYSKKSRLNSKNGSFSKSDPYISKL